MKALKVKAGDEVKAEHINNIIDDVVATDTKFDKIPAGPQGPKGETGSKGETGPIGAKGSDGLSVKALELIADTTGKITSGKMTLSDNSIVDVTITQDK
ncbi:collagen-like triple helix repeat-containing protein [Melissococcus plutonius]|uniref:collagen-like triple helix repeat-containing protein n=3 Tax=Melissococcus plutonius TaxID=33970 RepID=UPI0021E5FEEB|nr:collagen-like protein [Melissococcus plutonius]MCV2498211.1 collagen-like protein [Melissococcus plutonius]MCV2506826.1 collagen-like protein [Melissococcus plutonius]